MKNLSHKGIGQTDQLPEHFGTNNKLLKELQEIATHDTAKYFYNLEEQPEFIPINGPETFASLDVSKQMMVQVSSQCVSTTKTKQYLALMALQDCQVAYGQVT
jgi:hypothetical protein